MQHLVIKDLGLQAYEDTWQAMKEFTDHRTAQTADELWLLEHPPTYTLGQAGKTEHILNPSQIPIVNTDRGGQVTYHGPGQLIAYVLIDIKRAKIGVRQLVSILEESVVATLAEYTIEAYPKPDAPGVYVKDAKICSLGLRIRRGCSFHGLALNVDMDLTPFLGINPCGYQGLQMTQLSHLSQTYDSTKIKQQLTSHIRQKLAYNVAPDKSGL